jgi:hypothetical protein
MRLTSSPRLSALSVAMAVTILSACLLVQQARDVFGDCASNGGPSGSGYCITGDVVPCKGSGCLTFATFATEYDYDNPAPLCTTTFVDGQPEAVYASYVKVTVPTSWTTCVSSAEKEFYCLCGETVCATANFYSASTCDQGSLCGECEPMATFEESANNGNGCM